MEQQRQDAIRNTSPLRERQLPILLRGRSKNEENFGLVTTEISDLFVRLYQIAPLGSEILNLSLLSIHSSQTVLNEKILKQSSGLQFETYELMASSDHGDSELPNF